MDWWKDEIEKMAETGSNPYSEHDGNMINFQIPLRFLHIQRLVEMSQDTRNGSMWRSVTI